MYGQGPKWTNSESENRPVGSRDGERGRWNVIANQSRISFDSGENILELDSESGCTTLGM
jgi:hypothetical protein